MLREMIKSLQSVENKLTLSYIRDDGKTVTLIVHRKGINKPFVVEEIRKGKPFASHAIAGEFATFRFLTSKHDQLIKKHFHLITQGTQTNEY